MAGRLFQRFIRSSDGSIAPMFVVLIVPMVIAMGGTVDYTNAYDQKTIVQDAMDSAALAVGKKIGLLSLSAMTTSAESFYYSNVATRLANPPALQVAVETSTITLTTQLAVPTYFLGMIGLPHIDFDMKSQATLALGTLEVALVLDNSGSMNSDNNIAALRTAATNLTDTLFSLGATSTKPDPVKVGLVPFAGSVNVGAGHQTDGNATWLDKTGVGTYNLDAIDGTTTLANPFALLDGLNNANGSAAAWGGCLEARPMPYDTTDEAAVQSSSATVFVPMFAPDEPDNWTCSTGSCGYAGTTSSTRRFNGAAAVAQSYNNYLPDVAKTCGNIATMTIATPAIFTLSDPHHLVAGDQVVFSTTGALPGGLTAGTTYYVIAAGLNQASGKFEVAATSGGAALATSGTQSGVHSQVNSSMWTCASGAPGCAGSGNGAAETAALQSTCKYGASTSKVTMSAITVGGIPGGPNFMCTSGALTPLTTTKWTVTSAVASMTALGATNIQEGLMWGWRLLSPEAPFTQGRAASGENRKILILMTDGYNSYYPVSKYVGSWYGAWGYIYKNHLGTTSTSQSVEIAKMNERTAIACSNAKAAGVQIYTVAFTAVVDQATKDMLAVCATDASMAYVASDQSALINTFQAIGDTLSVLRLSH